MCVLSMCVLSLAPSRAKAQEALWLLTAQQQLAPWHDAVGAALEEEGVAVASRPESDADGCRVLQDALAAARAQGIQRVVCVTWTDGSGAAPARIAINLVRAPDAIGRGVAPIRAGDIARAVHAAYAQAELSLQLGASALLRVDSTPQGALVSLDGEPIGHAPLERRAPPGAHAVELSLDGFAGQEHRLELARGQVSELHATLARAELAGASAAGRASPLNWIVGGALVVASIPALASSLATLARDGDCASTSATQGLCTERVHFGTRSGVLLGLGAAALAAGTWVLLAQPFTIEAAVTPDAAMVRASARW